jgi:hypothetical protein
MARDLFHHAVRHALEKDGWVVTHDPYKLEYGSIRTLVDLGAERLIAAERGLERIAVEVKSFVGASEINEFHTALGQFLNYKKLLELTDPERVLYLAVPLETERTFLQADFPQMMLKNYQIRLVVYNPEPEVIVSWK